MLTLATLERSSGWRYGLALVVIIGFLWGSATELYQAFPVAALPGKACFWILWAPLWVEPGTR